MCAQRERERESVELQKKKKQKKIKKKEGAKRTSFFTVGPDSAANPFACVSIVEACTIESKRKSKEKTKKRRK